MCFCFESEGALVLVGHQEPAPLPSSSEVADERSEVALAGKQRRVLARPHQAPLGNRVQAEIQASLNFPVCVWLLSVSCPQEGTSFPLKASCALSNTGPCAGPPGTHCPVVELDRKWSSVTSSDDSGCKEESSMGGPQG